MIDFSTKIHSSQSHSFVNEIEIESVESSRVLSCADLAKNHARAGTFLYYSYYFLTLFKTTSSVKGLVSDMFDRYGPLGEPHANHSFLLSGTANSKDLLIDIIFLIVLTRNENTNQRRLR
jgi:hypothetical protein